MASRRTPRGSKEVIISVSKSPSRGRSEGSPSLWTVFSPHPQKQPNKSRSSLKTVSGELRAPEQTLTLLALRLAVLEKLATGLGKLAFIWATVVLLGGYVSSLSVFDFWVISGLLLSEGTRVFSRSKELEWQQLNSTSSTLLLLNKSTSAVKTAFSGFLHRQSSSIHEQEVKRDERRRRKTTSGSAVAKRIWSMGAVPFIPYAKFLPAKTMSTFLYFLQLGSAAVSIGFSVARLSKQDYGIDSEKSNRGSALNLFYALMLAEASFFLLERAYWEFKLRWRKLLAEVSQNCELDQDDIETVKKFFYAVHSKCLNGSVFDGLDMDLVGFSIEKIHSSIREEQLGSVKILSTLVSQGMSREETRRRIGTTPSVIERLLEMITWKYTSEREISKAAAWILYKLIRHQSNCFRVSATPGALEGIISLLLPEEEEEPGTNDMKVRGLTILKHLAKDHSSCIRIGNTGGLISILVAFIEVKEAPEHTQCKVLKKSLQLLKMMADTGGESGHSLRRRIASMVFAVRNLKDILQLGGSSYMLKLHALAVDVLTGLANEDEHRESIGATGAVIPSLLSLFMKETTVEGSDEFIVSMKAGEAVNLLVLQSPKNCSRLLNHNRNKEGSQILKGLIRMLFMHPQKGIRAAKILRSLCRDLNDNERLELGAAIPGVMKMVMELQGKEQEAAVALAASAIPFLDKQAFDAMLNSAVHQKTMLVAKMTELVTKSAPASSLIRIRRHSVELVSALMLKDAFFLQAFRRDGIMERHLERMLDTVSDVENFYTFSGTMGLTRHLHSLEDLINATLLNLRTGR